MAGPPDEPAARRGHLSSRPLYFVNWRETSTLSTPSARASGSGQGEDSGKLTKAPTTPPTGRGRPGPVAARSSGRWPGPATATARKRRHLGGGGAGRLPEQDTRPPADRPPPGRQYWPPGWSGRRGPAAGPGRADDGGDRAHGQRPEQRVAPNPVPVRWELLAGDRRSLRAVRTKVNATETRGAA